MPRVARVSKNRLRGSSATPGTTTPSTTTATSTCTTSLRAARPARVIAVTQTPHKQSSAPDRGARRDKHAHHSSIDGHAHDRAGRHRVRQQRRRTLSGTGVITWVTDTGNQTTNVDYSTSA